MNRLVFALVLFGLVAPVGLAGVVIEMESKGQGGDGAIDTVYAQARMLRMDPHEESRGERMSMIFRDDTLWMVDHSKKRCQTIDSDDIEAMSSQIGSAMKQMEEQLSQLPPEQRAMMEKMMKDRMPPGMLGKGSDAPKRHVEVGGTEQVGEYACTVHTLFAGEDKIWEVCAAKNTSFAAADEAMDAFMAMTEFSKKLREAFENLPFAGMIDTPFNNMSDIDGVPIRTRTYANGKLQSESTLKSITQRALDSALFEAPDGYKVSSLTDEMKKKRR